MAAPADRDAANALLAANGRCFRCPVVSDWVGSDLGGRMVQMPLHAMIKEIAKSMHLTPNSARLTGNAARALSAPVPMADLMDKEDALVALKQVAEKMVTRAEKRKKEEEEQAAAEQAANMARGQARAAKRVAIGSRLPHRTCSACRRVAALREPVPLKILRNCQWHAFSTSPRRPSVHSSGEFRKCMEDVGARALSKTASQKLFALQRRCGKTLGL